MSTEFHTAPSSTTTTVEVPAPAAAKAPTPPPRVDQGVSGSNPPTAPGSRNESGNESDGSGDDFRAPPIKPAAATEPVVRTGQDQSAGRPDELPESDAPRTASNSGDEGQPLLDPRPNRDGEKSTIFTRRNILILLGIMAAIFAAVGGGIAGFVFHNLTKSNKNKKCKEPEADMTYSATYPYSLNPVGSDDMVLQICLRNGRNVTIPVTGFNMTSLNAPYSGFSGDLLAGADVQVLSGPKGTVIYQFTMPEGIEIMPNAELCGTANFTLQPLPNLLDSLQLLPDGFSVLTNGTTVTPRIEGFVNCPPDGVQQVGIQVEALQLQQNVTIPTGIGSFQFGPVVPDADGNPLNLARDLYTKLAALLAIFQRQNPTGKTVIGVPGYYQPGQPGFTWDFNQTTLANFAGKLADLVKLLGADSVVIDPEPWVSAGDQAMVNQTAIRNTMKVLAKLLEGTGLSVSYPIMPTELRYMSAKTVETLADMGVSFEVMGNQPSSSVGQPTVYNTPLSNLKAAVQYLTSNGAKKVNYNIMPGCYASEVPPGSFVAPNYGYNATTVQTTPGQYPAFTEDTYSLACVQKDTACFPGGRVSGGSNGLVFFSSGAKHNPIGNKIYLPTAYNNQTNMFMSCNDPQSVQKQIGSANFNRVTLKNPTTMDPDGRFLNAIQNKLGIPQSQQSGDFLLEGNDHHEIISRRLLALEMSVAPNELTFGQLMRGLKDTLFTPQEWDAARIGFFTGLMYELTARILHNSGLQAYMLKNGYEKEAVQLAQFVAQAAVTFIPMYALGLTSLPSIFLALVLQGLQASFPGKIPGWVNNMVGLALTVFTLIPQVGDMENMMTAVSVMLTGILANMVGQFAAKTASDVAGLAYSKVAPVGFWQTGVNKAAQQKSTEELAIVFGQDGLQIRQAAMV